MSVCSCLLAYQDRFNRALPSVGLIQLCNNKKDHFHLMSFANRTGVITVSFAPDLHFFLIMAIIQVSPYSGNTLIGANNSYKECG